MSTAGAAPPLRVRVGSETVDGRDTAAVVAAIGRANAWARIDGLGDALNPALVDPVRALALIAALSDATVEALGSFSLYLNAPLLPLRPCSPTSLPGFAKLEGIIILDTQGDTVLTRPIMPFDCDLARAQATVAKVALAAEKAEVERLEAAKQAAATSEALHALSAAKARRFAIAGAWFENAEAASACAPNDAGASDELAAAQQARADYAVVTGGGLR